ncbi:MEDS domain-containing protein [Pseudonocardia hispaniensis]|uniref:MEDS domain-containing protein n=1 Tax=Pseudonocardia hispaniensis TaxID=904933 RepID=A0ABW1J5G4_9PSEU
MRPTAEVGPGDHACAIPVSEEQLWELSAGFVADGLVRNEQVCYFDDGTIEPVLRRLADDRVPVDRPLRTGQLEVVPAELTRQLFHSPLSEARSMMLARIDASKSLGYTGLRMTGQMSYGIVRPGLLDIIEFDTELDHLVRSRGVTTLCLYDRARYTESQIEQLRGLHDKELTPPTAYDDGLLRITRTGITGARLAGDVDHSNRPAVTRLLETMLDDALRSHSAPADIELNLASLRFIDVAGAVALVQGAEAFPSTHRLVLRDVRPRTVRVLDRCGAPFAAQLAVLEFDRPQESVATPSSAGDGAPGGQEQPSHTPEAAAEPSAETLREAR